MKTTDFNKGWEFNHGLNSDMAAGFTGATVEKNMINLPHDAMIFARRSKDSVTGAYGAFFEAENCEYKKSFFWSQEKDMKAVYLDFDGIYGNATILVNGDYVASCYNGYKNFQVQINDYLNAGQENTVKVIIKNNMQPNSRWYSGTGIYREVRLLTSNALHIVPDGVRITTLSADEEIAAISISTELKWEGIGSQSGEIINEFFDESNHKTGEASAAFNIKSGETLIVKQRVYIDNPILWNVGEGHMYQCKSHIVVNGEELDTNTTSFGIRTITLDNKNGLRINGESIKLKGGCVHHDNTLLGAVSLEDAEYRRVSKLQAVGYNAIRGAHNPMSRAFLNVCDKLGMLVMEEYTDTWSQNKVDFDYALFMPDNWENDIEDIVRHDYNHPSVIMYSIGNEIPETGSEKAASLGRKLAEKFRELDSTRLITNGINVMMSVIDRIGIIMGDIGMEMAQQGFSPAEINDLMNNTAAVMPKVVSHPLAEAATNESFDILDVIGLNYAEQAAIEQHACHPHRIYLGSETLPGKLDTNWKLVNDNPYIIGDFSWTAWDYLGEVGVGRIEELTEELPEGAMAGFMGDYPWITSFTGDFDMTGFRKPVSYWRETIWNGRNHEPYIAVQNPFHIGKKLFRGNWCWTDSLNSWNWPGAEGKEIVIEVYADTDEVELFINQKSLGIRKASDHERQHYFCWDTIYEPGEISAISYIDGKEAGRSELKTAAVPKLFINSDKTILKAGSNDLAFVEIELRDENGTLCMANDQKITLELEGAARLMASGSGNPCMEESFDSLEHMTFQGRMLAILQAGETPDEIRLTAHCDGMVDATVTIKQK